MHLCMCILQERKNTCTFVLMHFWIDIYDEKGGWKQAWKLHEKNYGSRGQSTLKSVTAEEEMVRHDA